ncbi:VOC family protein [Aestuariivirga sp.]|uniref:VOC family protein n=1 Tax=Aestuariivirga sp. TaxID=2650926 RepID=UPI0035931B63
MTGRPVHPGVMPHLICRGAAAAIDFYVKAFGATEMMRLPDRKGLLMHASVMVNGSMVMLMDEYLDYGARSPQSLGGTPVVMHMTVPDVDKAFATAVAAGATVVMPVADMFWGDRYGQVEDPFGHRWSLATTVKQLSPDEIMENLRKMEQAP